jgi:hypothetical protein
VCFVGALSRPNRVVNAVLEYPCENLSYYVLRHFGFHGATVCVCIISGGLLPNKYVNKPLNPKSFG